MIFPIADLVPDICAGLSARDIRAIACVSRDVHGMIAPFMIEHVEKTHQHLSTSDITHYKSAWPHLHRFIKREIVIHSDWFRIDTSRLAYNYTGVITILCGDSSYYSCDRAYVSVHDGIALYGVSNHWYKNRVRYDTPCVYGASYGIHFTYFIDDFMVRILRGITNGGYISEGKISELRTYAYVRGYNSLQKFIGSEDFMKIIMQW